MTQKDDPPAAHGPVAEGPEANAAAAEGPATDNTTSPAEGTATGPAPDSFTLAGPGSDPAAPAVQPVRETPAQFAAPPAAGPVGAAPSGDYDKYGVPTMDFVRDKIEARYAASLGAEELARQTQEAKSFEQRAEERAKAAEAALDEIRKSLRDHRQS
jgi:hypothetical protein